MATLPDPCTGQDIARRLGSTYDWWLHNWKELVERHGFPVPLPGFRRPRKWDPAQVEAWITKPRRTIDSDAPLEVDRDALAEELSARAAAIAGGADLTATARASVD